MAGEVTRASPLLERHRALGATFTEIAGLLVPAAYGSLAEEHRAVRECVGLFDISRVGIWRIKGNEAASSLSHALTVAPHVMADGEARRAVICRGDGGIVGDVTLFRLARASFVLVANGESTRTVRRELAARLAGSVAVTDRSAATASLSVQGPGSVKLMVRLVDHDLHRLGRGSVTEAELLGFPVLISRTGSTGEDGFELFVDRRTATSAWEILRSAGKELGLAPVGYAATEALRLEAGLPRFGAELTPDVTPLTSGCDWLVESQGATFAGCALLSPRREARRLVSLAVAGTAIPPRGTKIIPLGSDDVRAIVTSSAWSPLLGRPLALASVPSDLAAPGTGVELMLGEHREAAEVIPHAVGDGRSHSAVP